jgi:hypothetical protein
MKVRSVLGQLLQSPAGYWFTGCIWGLASGPAVTSPLTMLHESRAHHRRCAAGHVTVAEPRIAFCCLWLVRARSALGAHHGQPGAWPVE